jgi:dTDP-4-amino-4,6-dideoxygalactose transaminase
MQESVMTAEKVRTRTRPNMLVFGSPLIGEEEVQEVAETLRSGWLGTGPRVRRFEEAFREYAGAKHAMALNSCTAGLHLALIVAGLRPGDEVITTPMTFCATANTVLHAGGRPVFADVDRRTMNIDPQRVEDAITPRTRAIVPVHFAGRPCDMDALMDIARRHDLMVIEDAAHCIEGLYKGRKIGSIGDMTCFSFYVTKNIVTGEGGMVTTNRDVWADKVKMYGLHGMNKDAWKRYSDEGFKHYQVVFPGFKYNMMDIQAAIGLHQLRKVEPFLSRRETVWETYDRAFAGLPVFVPEPAEPDTRHARHLYTLLLDLERLPVGRDEFQQRLHRRNIGTGIHFTALHLHEYYRKTFGYKPDDFPNARWISERTISLPLSAKLTDEDVDDVVAAVREELE